MLWNCFINKKIGMNFALNEFYTLIKIQTGNYWRSFAFIGG